jgi:RNA recognition motif-containing protein
MYHNSLNQGQKDNFGAMNDDLTSTLFLGDLSVICDEAKLYELFHRCGVIESIQLKKSDRDPQRAHLGFGFIKFANREAAAKARLEMNGYFFLGRAMRVGWAVDFGKKRSQLLMDPIEDSKKLPTAQIHVMFVTRELHRRVSELDIGAVFRRYGNLVDIAIKKNAINHVKSISPYFLVHGSHFSLSPIGIWRAVRICFPSFCFDI